jgi:S-adenosylmethionine:tRNA ribosyltransferase-isomerase
VSAGTFQPVKSENAIEHDMHPEQIIISRESIENLLQENKIIIAVGTTSMRVLESIYWFGVTLLNDEGAQFSIGKMDAYRFSGQPHPSRQVSIGAVLNHMKLNSLDQITGSTSIYILPGYEFKMVDGLITNFHQPGSTLILLVAAFVGEDWRKIYAEALNNNYRFLSYGDSSLLLPAMKYLQRK